MNKFRLWGKLESFIAAIGIGAISLSSYALWLTSSSLQQQRPLVQANETLSQNVALAHFWLEQALAGDRGINLNQDIYGNLDQAIAITHAMLYGGKTSAGNIQLIGDAKTRTQLQSISNKLQFLRTLTDQRLRNVKSSQSGSAIDQQYDETFKQTLALIDEEQATIALLIARIFWHFSFSLPCSSPLSGATVKYLKPSANRRLSH